MDYLRNPKSIPFWNCNYQVDFHSPIPHCTDESAFTKDNDYHHIFCSVKLLGLLAANSGFTPLDSSGPTEQVYASSPWGAHCRTLPTPAHLHASRLGLLSTPLNTLKASTGTTISVVTSAPAATSIEFAPTGEAATLITGRTTHRSLTPSPLRHGTSSPVASGTVDATRAADGCGDLFNASSIGSPTEGGEGTLSPTGVSDAVADNIDALNGSAADRAGKRKATGEERPAKKARVALATAATA
ncbi:hypothetical protein C8J57DRAFT_1526137 [Mycena rebaudengoi]|nr:hypothetical protein C8J57DRAFT_1526137 [Mycena rebaudengoi]